MIQSQPYVQLVGVDDSQSVGYVRLHVRRSLDRTQVEAGAAAMRARLRSVSSIAFVRDNIIFPGVETAPRTPAAGVQLDRRGVFIFGTVSPDEFALVELPGIVDSVLVTTGPTAGLNIDQAAPAVQAFVAQLTNGSWCNEFGYPLTTLEAAYVQIRV